LRFHWAEVKVIIEDDFTDKVGIPGAGTFFVDAFDAPIDIYLLAQHVAWRELCSYNVSCYS